MVSLLKQVFKSLKYSILSIIGLIFIFFAVAFTMFSTLFMYFNIDYSLKNIRNNGNSSSVILEKKYNVSNPVYDYQTNADKPTLKDVYTSNYMLDYNVNWTDANGFANNVIFPYQAADFKNPNVNIVDDTTNKVAPYNDKNLSRYTSRKKGVLKANLGPLSIEMLANINVNNPSSWRGIGWQMKNENNEVAFDPQNLVFDSNMNKPTLKGYFSNGIINSETLIFYGMYQPKNANIDPLITNGVVKQPSINFIYSQPFLIDWDINQNLLDQVFYSDLFTALTTNVKSEKINHYKIFLRKDSLTGVDKYIYEKIVSILTDPTIDNISNPSNKYKDFLTSLLTVETPIKQSWIDSYDSSGIARPTDTEIINSYLRNQAQNLASNFSTFIEKYRDDFVLDYLNTQFQSLDNKDNSIEQSSSFSFYDREYAKNFLVVSKESAINDTLIIQDGIAPQSSEIFYEYKNIINNLNSKSNKYIDDVTFRKIIYDFSKLMLKLPPPLLKNDINDAANLPIDFDTKYLEVEYGQITKNDINTLVSISKELILQYESKIPYDQRLINKLFAYLSNPEVAIDEFRKLAINLNYKEGVIANSSTASVRLSGFFPQNYQAVVTEKFISATNKKILPLKNIANPELSWNHALSLSSNKEFDVWLKTLPSEYKLEINSLEFIITGTGLSADMSYPIFSFNSPIIDPNNDILVYVNNAGYESISKKISFINEVSYFSFAYKDKTSIDTFVNKLNSELSAIMNGSTSNVAFKVDDSFLNSPLISIRYSFPKIIQFCIQVFSLLMTILLLVIGIYLSFIIIKSWINKSRIQLAIINANGFSTGKITLCMSLISLIIAVFGGSLGYTLAIVFQQLLFSIISPYIFLASNFFVFNVGWLLLTILVIFVISTLFIFINLKLLFKKPIASIINQTIEQKNNVFIKALNTVQAGFSSNLKLKNQLLFLNVPRTFFYLLSSTMCIFLIGAFTSFSQKLYLAQSLTNENKQFSYSLDLVSPTEQGGLHRNQEYSELGFPDSTKGIGDAYFPIYNDDPSTRLPYDKNTLKVLEKVVNQDGSITWEHKRSSDIINPDGTITPGRPLYFSNLILASEKFLRRIITHYDTFRNGVFSKWLIDLEIKPGFNIWSYVRKNLHPEIVAKVESKDKVFTDLIANDADLGTEFKTYAIQDPLTKQWKLDAKKVLISRPDIKFIDDFLIFIGKVYGKEHLSNSDIKISYGIVPMYSDVSETYTYVNANILNNNIDKKYKIYGIKPNSNYISLKDNNSNHIGHLLDSNDNNIIINNGAAYKYDLKVGDTISLDVLNSYFRHSEKMLNVDLNDKYEFKVVAVSSTSFGEEFFISQNKANEITNLNKGVIKGAYGKRPILPVETPYNGLLSNEKEPLLLNKTLSFYSLFGLYGNFGRFNLSDARTSSVLEWTIPSEYFVAFISSPTFENEKIMINAYNAKNNTNLNADELRKKIMANTTQNSNTLLTKYVVDWFQEDVNPIVLSSLENYSLENEINDAIFYTLEILQMLLIVILLPIIIFVILILTSSMMEEIKKIILAMKLLGYSNRNNLFSILYVFIPIFFFSILFGTLFVWLSMVGFQSFLYSLTSIFVNSLINIPNLMYAFLALFVIMFINFLFTVFTYKKTKINLILN